MSLLETAVAVAVAATLVIRVTPSLRKRRVLRNSTWMTPSLALVFLLVDGFRWQMLPFLSLSIVLLVLNVKETLSPPVHRVSPTPRWMKVMGIIIVSLVYLGALVFPALLPVVDLPKPSGPYAVGTRDFGWTDPSRLEILTEDPQDSRTIGITMWYPGELIRSGRTRAYWNLETGRAYSLNSGMGPFWYSHLRRVETNGLKDIPVANLSEPMPVVLYSPSFFGLNSENTRLMEELASRGYAVLAISHSYESIATVLPDAPTLFGDWEGLTPFFDTHEDLEEDFYRQYNLAEDDQRRRDILQEIFVVDELSNTLTSIRSADLIFVLNELEKLAESGDPLASNMDLDRVAVMGWSFGGAAAQEACLLESRFKACVNIDGWPSGTVFNSGPPMSQAFLRLESGDNDDEEMEGLVSDIILERMSGPAYTVRIEGARHINFWDFPTFFPIYAGIGFWGLIPADRLHEISSAFILGFLDRYLRNEDMRFPEDLDEKFPEVVLTQSSRG